MKNRGKSKIIYALIKLLILAYAAYFFTQRFLQDSATDQRLSRQIKVPDNSDRDLFVMVMTSPNTFDRSITVYNTWFRRSDPSSVDIRFIMASSETDAVSTEFEKLTASAEGLLHPFMLNRRLKLPPKNFYIQLRGLPEKGSHHITEKTLRAWHYVYNQRSFEIYRWYYKCDDDTYVITDNLMFALASYDPDQSLFIGRVLHTTVMNGEGFNSGGAGYVFSRKLIQEFGPFIPECLQKVPEEIGEDVAVASCLKFYLNVTATHLASLQPVFPSLISAWKAWDTSKNIGFLPRPASIHYVPGIKMYELDYLIHEVAPKALNKI